VEALTDFLFLGSKITADGGCSHKIKRLLFLGRKVITNLNQFSSVAQSGLTPCNPMNHSTPGLPIHHYLPNFAQDPVHCISDAVLPSHPLMPSFPSALNLSQHQGLFQ